MPCVRERSCVPTHRWGVWVSQMRRGCGAGHTLHVAPAVSSSCLTVTWQWPRAGCPDRPPPNSGAAAASPPVAAVELRQLAEYLERVLQWEGPGSLSAALKRRGWASQVEAYCDENAFSRNAAYWLFQARAPALASVLSPDVRVAAL